MTGLTLPENRLGLANEVRAEIEASGFRYAEEIRVPGLVENYLLRFERTRR